MRKLYHFVAYTFYAINLLIITLFWWHGSGREAGTLHGQFIIYGRLTALLSAYAILWVFVLASRVPLLERAFGMDEQLKLHRWAGDVAIGLLLAHIILSTLGYAMASHIGAITQFIQFIVGWDDMLKALAGTILFILVVGLSIMIVRRHLKYETWYLVHLTSYLAVILAFGHQLKDGVDLLTQPLFVDYWWALYILALGLWLVYRIIKPMALWIRHDFRVEKVVQEANNIFSIYVKGRNIENYAYDPGQFAFWRFLNNGQWWQGHPFSYSSEPGKHLRLTFKQSGDYTSELALVKPGTRIIIDGPYGKFTNRFRKSDKLLLIAGGIGITPIISMLPDLAEQTSDIIIFYAARTAAEIAFTKELTKLVEHYHLKIFYVLSDEPDYPGLTGFIDRQKLRGNVPDLSRREIYLCGPPPMMVMVAEALIEEGVPKSLIHTEKFEF